MLMGGRLTEDHIIPLNTGGMDDVGNLCWCCWWCNVFKGSQATASDSRTGVVEPLFNPRQDLWETHFRWSRSERHVLLARTHWEGTHTVLRDGGMMGHDVRGATDSDTRGALARAADLVPGAQAAV